MMTEQAPEHFQSKDLDKVDSINGSLSIHFQVFLSQT